MSNHLYGYTSSTYGGGGGGSGGSLFSSRSAADKYTPSDASLLATTSRYLSASSSSLLYNPDSYSGRIPGFSAATTTRSYGPPGVDVPPTSVLSDPLYAGLKRTSAECKESPPSLVLFYL